MLLILADCIVVFLDTNMVDIELVVEETSKAGVVLDNGRGVEKEEGWESIVGYKDILDVSGVDNVVDSVEDISGNLVEGLGVSVERIAEDGWVVGVEAEVMGTDGLVVEACVVVDLVVFPLVVVEATVEAVVLIVVVVGLVVVDVIVVDVVVVGRDVVDGVVDFVVAMVVVCVVLVDSVVVVDVGDEVEDGFVVLADVDGVDIVVDVTVLGIVVGVVVVDTVLVVDVDDCVVEVEEVEAVDGAVVLVVVGTVVLSMVEGVRVGVVLFMVDGIVPSEVVVVSLVIVFVVGKDIEVDINGVLLFTTSAVGVLLMLDIDEVVDALVEELVVGMVVKSDMLVDLILVEKFISVEVVVEVDNPSTGTVLIAPSDDVLEIMLCVVLKPSKLVDLNSVDVPDKPVDVAWVDIVVLGVVEMVEGVAEEDVVDFETMVDCEVS